MTFLGRHYLYAYVIYRLFPNLYRITNESELLDVQFSSFGTQAKPNWPSYQPILFIIDPFSLFRLQ